MGYTRTWRQLAGRGKPGRRIGRVSHVIKHTEAGADLPASATVAQEVRRWRAIDAFHRSIGWGGAGYSVMTCQSGRYYEMRGYGVSGAHTVGHNTTALASVTPGHGDRTPLSEAAIAADRAWVSEGIRQGAIASAPRVTGHRDWAAKSCPGNLVYPQLHRLRGVTADDERIPDVDDDPILGVLMKQGDRGDDVRTVQRHYNDWRHAFNALGHLSPEHPRTNRPPLVVDGEYGPATHTAFHFAQSQLGLVTTGEADGLTLLRMVADAEWRRNVAHSLGGLHADR